MGFNSPVPVRLPDECSKARKILNSFIDGSHNGLDQVIPRSVLAHAKGFAIFTVAKAGFLVSARAGSGIVVARLPNGEWSAPTAIGTAGLGFGGQAGAEVTDFLIVLNSRSAVASFMAAGSLNLGGNMSLAVGPLGRNAEGMGALNTKGKVAAMYSYSKTKGLFGGVSVEGSVIVERQDANRLAYGSPVTAKQLLSGTIPIPPFADALIAALVSATGLPGGRAWVDDFAPSAEGTGWEAEPVTPLGSPAGERPAYAFAGIGSDGRGSPSAAAGGSSGGGGVGGQPTLGGRTRSGSLLSSVIGRNRSGSLQNAQAGATSSGGGRDRGLSVGSAPSAGAGGGRPDSPSSRPGLFSAVSFGRKRGNSRASSSGYDGSLALGDDSAFHSSESYTSAAPLGSFGAPRSSPSVASPLKPTTTTATTTTATAAGTSRFDERFDASSSSDSLAAGGGGLLGVEDDFARSGLGSSSGGGRGNSFESRYDSQRYSVDDGPAPFSPFDDDAPSSSVHFGPSGPHLASPPPKKPKRPFFSSSPSSSSKLATSSSDFHTRPNTYYDDADAGDVFADPEGAELALIRDGVGRGSVRAEEDWSALGAGARAGLARTQSGNVLSAAAAAAGGSTAGGTTTVPVLAQKKGFELDAGELRARGYVGRGVALFDFQGVEPGDLTFARGDVVLLIQKTSEANDWWTGSVGPAGRSGSFPGTYVQLVD